MSAQNVRTISFSGIDGAGKTTQIDELCTAMEAKGLQVRLIRFWDDIAQFTRFRESAGHRIFKGDKGIGSPSAPINRKDKNVRSWPMAAVRLFLYLADALALRNCMRIARSCGAEVVIFDRFIYDELANLNLGNPVMRWYARFIMRCVPRPSVSLLLDADPAAARARKPEYPIEFIWINRRAYLTLSELIGGITIIRPNTVHEVKREVLASAFDAFRIASPGSEQAFAAAKPGNEGAKPMDGQIAS